MATDKTAKAREVPLEQKMLRGNLARVIDHQVYNYTKRIEVASVPRVQSSTLQKTLPKVPFLIGRK